LTAQPAKSGFLRRSSARSVPAGRLLFASLFVAPGFVFGSYGIFEHRVVSLQAADVFIVLESNGLDDFEELM
jgi:hypothetical protein